MEMKKEIEKTLENMEMAWKKTKPCEKKSKKKFQVNFFNSPKKLKNFF